MDKSKIVMCFRNNKATFFFSIITFTALSLLFFLFPYSCDDWAWGSPIGLERLFSLFDNYNGRYAGNILVIILTRSKIINVALTAFLFSAFCILPKVFTDSKFFISLPFAFFLLIFMPKDLWIQTVVWTSGFSNYVPPILLITLYLCIVKNVFGNKCPTYSKSMTFWAGVIGFGASLFMENVTIYGLIASVLIIALSYIKFKKIFAVQIANLLGCILGTVFMFSNSAYASILNGTDYYRSTALDYGFFSTVLSHAGDISKYFFTNNLCMLLIVTLLCAIITFIYVKSSNNTTGRIISVVVFLLNGISFSIIAVKYPFEQSQTTFLREYAEIFLAVIYSITVFLSVAVCIRNKVRKQASLFVLVSIPILISPLLVVNPINARCFFPPYFMCVILCILILDYILNCTSFNKVKIKTSLCIGLIFANIAALVFMFNTYIPVHKYYVKREEYLDKQIELGFKTITLCKLPNSAYVISPDPDSEFWDVRYRLLNNIDSDVTLEFLSADEFDIWAEKFDKGVIQQ